MHWELLSGADCAHSRRSVLLAELRRNGAVYKALQCRCSPGEPSNRTGRPQSWPHRMPSAMRSQEELLLAILRACSAQQGHARLVPSPAHHLPCSCCRSLAPQDRARGPALCQLTNTLRSRVTYSNG